MTSCRNSDGLPDLPGLPDLSGLPDLPGLPGPDGRHPGFAPYRRLREELLNLPAGDWVARCDAVAAARGLRSATGTPIRFVIGPDPTGALAYEAAILHDGRVTCRPAGRGALHDLHNALVWLTFPQTKATLNRLHFSHRDSPSEGRGRLRDMLTLLDENGLLWLSDAPELDAQLLAKDWTGLLVQNRELVCDRVVPIVLGHGLLEKLASPYKSMTAHCLICSGRWGADVVHAPEAIDGDVAARLAAWSSEVPQRLAPLPILGLPGWDPSNDDRSYYADARVFRSPRLRRA